MAKSISCEDAGSDCGWSATAGTTEELMAITEEHIEEFHKDLQVTPELAEKLKTLMKDV